jgi:putative transcriptional regulator
MPAKKTSQKLSPRGKRLLRSLTHVKEYFEGSRKLHVYHYDIPDPIDVRAIREKTGLSQADFADQFAISPRTLQEWEQGRRVPDATVRAYLTLIDRNPSAVQKALAGEKG